MTIAQSQAEAREREYHRIMVAHGLRPEGSTVEQYRPRKVVVDGVETLTNSPNRIVAVRGGVSEGE